MNTEESMSPRFGKIFITKEALTDVDALEKSKQLNLCLKVMDKVMTGTHLVIWGYSNKFRCMTIADKTFPLYKVNIERNELLQCYTVDFEEITNG